MRIEDYFSKEGIDYYRMISSDETLAKALVAELKRRDVDPTRTATHRLKDDDASTKSIHPDHIALISEWDTVYGQMLPELITRAFDPAAYITSKRSLEYPSWIMPFSYLRGLDGQLPNPKSTKDQKLPDNDSSVHTTDTRSNNAANQMERAEGQSQFDYLRRLADQIHQRDEELRQGNEGHIAAIGVLGSDVYDKLLILQALRPEFPEALFFTTDLDAELLSQSKSQYVRNVIVASSYDLKLRDTLQADIPPFRSTYQTSIFLTARLAIEYGWARAGGGNPDTQANISFLPPMPRPRLFQIGRTGAYPLPVDPADLSRDRYKDDCARNILDCSSVQPRVRNLFPDLKAGSLVSAILLVSAVLIGALMSSRKLRQLCFIIKAAQDAPPPTISRRVGPITILSLVALVVSTGLCVSWPNMADTLTQHGFGEPMTVFEGISVWPSIIMRLIGCGLSLWLIFYTIDSLESNRQDTEKRLALSDSRSLLLRQSESRRSGRSITSWLEGMRALLWFPQECDHSKCPLDDNRRPIVPFNNLVDRSSGVPARLIRAFAGTLGIFVLGMILVPILGRPNTPARGTLAHGIFEVVTLMDVFVTMFLIFLVADATLYSRSFIKRLAEIHTEWPENTAERFERQLGLDRTNLDDWIDMQFLAARTRCITRLIYFPFLALALMIVSRSRLFDDFTFPPSLVILQAVSLALIVASVLALRWTAEDSRATACDHLTAKIIAARGVKGGDKLAGQLEILLNRVQSLKEGAFAPLSSQPIVKALLLPLLSYGGTVLAQMYALPGL